MLVDEDHGDYAAPSGLALWGTQVKGDPGCAALLETDGRRQPDSFAYVFTENKSLSLEQAVESYATEEAAEDALAQKRPDVAGTRAGRL